MTWMAWTLPTAVFFLLIALCLAAYSLWGVVAPSTARKGFLPMSTTRGDRLFVGLLGSAYINLAWTATSDAPLWYACALWIPWLFIVGRWG